MKSPRNALVLLVLLGVLAGEGCVPLATSRLTLPAGQTVVRDQLVVHSDFRLTASHRLIEELAARRIDLKNRLGVPLSDEPIHVYLFEDANRFEAFVRLYYPEFPPRRAYFLETDTRLEVYAQWGDRVAEDLRHEVTHGYLHSVVPNLPLWLDEGLAEYFEVPRGSRGLNRRHLAELVGRLQLGQWEPDLKRLEAFDRPFDMTQDDYAEAWAWAHFLLESSPDHGRVLHEYFLALRRHGSAEPISERLSRCLAEPEAALVEHVERTAAGADLWPASQGDGAASVGT
ncbi:MAG TPA: DUF1570 domain-containing protein [Thermoguttaceae bacterium]|nr:DUF1570 domain-containing protein [Thermoguttaceae bacterium]